MKRETISLAAHSFSAVRILVEMSLAEIKQFQAYFTGILRGEAEIDHFWFFHAGKMLSWVNADEAYIFAYIPHLPYASSTAGSGCGTTQKSGKKSPTSPKGSTLLWYTCRSYYGPSSAFAATRTSASYLHPDWQSHWAPWLGV